MKTLKKTLCLVLAVVMAVGVLILPANADKATYEDFDDLDKINPDYEIAVATLTGMGIIAGKDNGFDPQGTLLRQEAATLVVNMMLTKAQQKTALLGYTSDFVDISGSYAKDQINYLVAKGMISGKDATHFAPYATLTTYELLSMLRQVAEEMNDYTTEDGQWTAQAMKFASDYGIVDAKLPNDILIDGNKVPTREQAAQMIWKVMTKSAKIENTTYTVYKDTGANPSETKTADWIVQDTNVAWSDLPTWRAILGDKFRMEEQPDYTGTIGGKVYNLAPQETTDAYGRPSNAYTDGNADTTKLVVFSEHPIASEKVYTDQAVSMKKIFKDDLKVFNAKVTSIDVTLMVNGKQVALSDYTTFVKNGTTAATASVITGTSSTIDDDTKIGGRGTTVEVYKTDDGEYTVVVIPTYVAVLGDPVEDTDVIVIEGEYDPDDDNKPLEACVYVKTGDFSKGDVVLYTKGVNFFTGAVETKAELAKTVSGYVSSKSNGSNQYFRLNATADKYYLATTAKNYSTGASADFAFDSVVAEDKYAMNSYYLDARNNVFALYNPPENVAPGTVPNYIYIIDYDEYLTKADGLYDNANVASDAGARIKYLDLATGKTATADLAVAKYQDDWYLAKAGGVSADTTRKILGHDKLNDNNSNSKNIKGFMSYIETENGLVLSGPAAADKNATSSSKLELTNKSALVKVGSDSLYGTNDTVLNLIKVKNGAYTVEKLTGYKKFADINNGNNAYSVDDALVVTSRVTGKTSIVTSIYALYNEEPDTSEKLYGIYLGIGETSVDGTVYSFLVAGEVVSLTSTSTQTNLTTVGQVFELNLTNGVLHQVGTAKTGVGLTDITVIDEGTFVAKPNSGAVKQYTLSANTVIYDAVNGKVVTEVPTDLTKIDVTAYDLSSTADDVLEIIVITKKPA